jgi:hypothetical protein
LGKLEASPAHLTINEGSVNRIKGEHPAVMLSNLQLEVSKFDVWVSVSTTWAPFPGLFVKQANIPGKVVQYFSTFEASKFPHILMVQGVQGYQIHQSSQLESQLHQ